MQVYEFEVGPGARIVIHSEIGGVLASSPPFYDQETDMITIDLANFTGRLMMHSRERRPSPSILHEKAEISSGLLPNRSQTPPSVSSDIRAAQQDVIVPPGAKYGDDAHLAHDEISTPPQRQILPSGARNWKDAHLSQDRNSTQRQVSEPASTVPSTSSCSKDIFPIASSSATPYSPVSERERAVSPIEARDSVTSLESEEDKVTDQNMFGNVENDGQGNNSMDGREVQLPKKVSEPGFVAPIESDEGKQRTSSNVFQHVKDSFLDKAKKINFVGGAVKDTVSDDANCIGTEESTSILDGELPALKRLGANWGHMLMVASMRNRMPSRVRQRRLLENHLTPSGLDIEPPEKPPTTLHTLCGSPVVTLAELHACLEENSGAAAILDVNGRLPLHILGDNDELVGTLHGRQIGTAFGYALMKAYPEGVTTTDKVGHMPFVKLVDDWVLSIYETYRKSKRSDSIPNTARGIVDRVKGLTPRNMIHKGTDSTQTQAQSKSKSDLPSSSSAFPSEIKSVHTDRSDLFSLSCRAFPAVELWDEVEWAFEMLSLAMDELGGKSGGLHQENKRATVHHSIKDRSGRHLLSTHVVTIIPTLLKTVLLLEDDGKNTRKRLLGMSIFRRMLICPESVGPWLTQMLRRTGVPARRAVDYLVLMSESTVEDYVGGFRTIQSGDQDNFVDEKGLAFGKVDQLEGLIASLVTMDARETERAASTSVVWHVMSKNLGRPFVVALVLIDFCLHLVLLMAFRNDVEFQGRGESTAVGNVPTQIVIFICVNYFLRKACEALALLNISTQVFRTYFSNVWVFFDISAIVLTLIAIIWNDRNPGSYRQGLNAFILALLWVKILGILKVINRQMSTFILALIQILKDIRYFMVVLIVILFMFGDMMHIALSTKDNGQFCIVNEEAGTLSGPAEDFCSSEQFVYYLRMYGLLLGEFELDDYKETNAMIIIFVAFTLLGVVVLLNVLIAVISDSYEKAKISSMLLFGRARVQFVAQTSALESFLRPGAAPLVVTGFGERFETFVKSGSRFGRWLILLAIIGTAMNSEIYLVARAIVVVRGNGFSFVTLFTLTLLCVVLTLALCVVIVFTFDKALRKRLPAGITRQTDKVDTWSTYLIGLVGGRLFGLYDKTKSDTDHNNEEAEEWTGRMTYLEHAIEKQIKSASDNLKDEIRGVEKRIYERKFAAEAGPAA